jgi:hypothetical protein
MKIYCFCNGGSPGWYVVMAMAEDGHVLASHVCSEEATGSVLLNKKTRFNALQRLRPILQSDPRIQAYGDDGGDGDGPDRSGECD